MSSRPSSSSNSLKRKRTSTGSGSKSSSGGGGKSSSSGSGGKSSARKSSSGKVRSSSKSPKTSFKSDSSSSVSSSSSTSSSSSLPPSASSSKDLFSYLETLPRETILSLYTDARRSNKSSKQPKQQQKQKQEQQRGSYVAKCVLQKLPEMARQFVIRLTVCGGVFPLSEMEAWIAGKHPKRRIRQVLRRMEALCVIQPLSPPKLLNANGETKVRLEPDFHTAIKTSLMSLRSSPYPEVTPEQIALFWQQEPKVSNSYPNGTPTFQQLETFTQERWDSVLHFLVGQRSHEEPHPSVVDFLEMTGLMRSTSDGSSSKSYLEITAKGYEFMLNDVHHQVWQFILQYLALKFKNDPEQCVEVVLFLICLSYCRVGSVYNVDCLTDESKILLRDFYKFGLVYICRINRTTLFYPTRVAINLVLKSLNENNNQDSTSDDGDPNPSSSTSSSSSSNNTNDDTTNHHHKKYSSPNFNLGVTTVPAATVSATRALALALASPTPPSNHIAIIVQTNFQVVAYTTSPVHVSMLGLFCDERGFRRLPNVIFFRITRDTVKRAFRLGINAGQILRFLKMHAHPRLRNKGAGGGAEDGEPLVPGNVEDQIILWDRERYRVRFQEVYKELCKSDEEYNIFLSYAKKHGLFAWSKLSSREIMVKLECAKKFMDFVNDWRSKCM